MRNMVRLQEIVLLVACVLWGNVAAAAEQAEATPNEEGVAAKQYQEAVLADHPVGYWRFQDGDTDVISNVASHATEGQALNAEVVGSPARNQPGPQTPEFPLFGEDNFAVSLEAKGSYLSVKDPGENSSLDFDNGDEITLEAWVNPSSFAGSEFHYIIGKGRTRNPDFAADNQNYALRLTGPGGKLSFLFRSRGEEGDWHRWTSKTGISTNDGWHHVVVSYKFGEPDSIRGYIDGKPVKGSWDKAGKTDRAPVVDDDELRIGSTFEGLAPFQGLLDEIALYRSILSAERVAAHFRYVAPPLKPIAWADLTEGNVLVEIFEGLPDKKSWDFRPPQFVESYSTNVLAFVEVAKKYNSKGLQIDRSNPFLLRAAGKLRIPKGTQRILLRSRNAARLYLDDRLIAETKFFSIPSSGHGKVFDVDMSLAPNIRPLRRGDTEALAQIEGDGQSHRFRFELIVGGQQHRPELGDTSVSIAPPGEDFRLLSDEINVPLTNEGWLNFARQQRLSMVKLNRDRRRELGREENEYWNKQHTAAREQIADQAAPEVPKVADESAVYNDIDRFIVAKLEANHTNPATLLGDLAFLRRVALDVIGTIPTPSQIEEFLQDPPNTRRSKAIDRLLNEPGWADNWMGYWQDVLAENPALVKPKLNNSGPFRWWLYESFLDNKPFDRFAAELVRMEGSRRYGGPAGFELATQNDVPMAAKAQIIGRAFLGLNMTCARCHDAPFHDFLQKDLFSLAAMLGRKPQSVPATSSIPGGDDAVESLIVKVTLKPGSRVDPEWTFSEIVSASALSEKLHNSTDSREQLAALITSPSNHRFAEVIVNRMWRRYLGRGLVEPVDDWQGVQPSHPQLLQYLARELVLHDYDLKHIARLILNSHTYQRTAVAQTSLTDEQLALFAGPLTRRMRAEQIADSLFLAAGKPFDAGQLCLDIDGAMKLNTAINLGVPDRAWQFASLSNERDRPSLALPLAQPFVSMLETFGWRSSRQNPITDREDEPTVRQPAVLANGLIGRRISRLSDDSAFTQQALRKQPLEELVEGVYLRMLSRSPSSEEQKLFVALLADGYEDRLRDSPDKPQTRDFSLDYQVSWSNHLSSRANEIKVELQRIVEKGDPPTSRLEADWRERLEDMLWTVMNSPEFVFVP